MNLEKILFEKYELEIPDLTHLSFPYDSIVQTGNLLYISGQTPKKNGKLVFEGKLGDNLTIEQGQKASIISMLNCLGVIKKHVKNIDKVKQFVQVVALVRSHNDFLDQPLVINPASKLLKDVFQNKGNHSRYAFGTNALPGGAHVEISCIV